MANWSALLRDARKRRGMRQDELAEAAGVSIETLSRYERNVGRPSRPRLLRLCQALGLDREATNAILASAELDPLPGHQFAPFEERRGSLEAAQQEIDGYPWPCLVQNDRSEIVLWNPPAGRVAELDFARELPQLYRRNLIRIAAMDHFRTRVVNWAEVAGAMIGMFKGMPSMDIGSPASLSPYYVTVVTDLAREHPAVLQELFALWQQKPTWDSAARLVFPAHWRLANGAELHFDCVHSPWSLFDSTSTIDWFPADAATCRWLYGESRPSAAERRERVAKIVPRTPWYELLRMGREGAGLTRHALAETAGRISAETLKKYEQGERRPPRETLLRLAWAMELNGATINAMLTDLGYDPEPSEWSRAVLGEQAPTHFYSELPLADRALRDRQRMDEHIARQHWPCLLVSEECRIVAVNPAMARLLGSETAANGRRRTLLYLALGERFRTAVVNWEDMVTAVLPSALKQSLAGDDVGALPPWLREALADAHREDPSLLPRLGAALRAAPSGPSTYRVVVPLYWRTEDERLLSFTCVLSLWSGSDTIWALDWHPSDGDTWAWLAQSA